MGTHSGRRSAVLILRQRQLSSCGQLALFTSNLTSDMVTVHCEYDDAKKQLYFFVVCHNCKEAAGERFAVPSMVAPLLYQMAGKTQIRIPMPGVYYCGDCADKVETLVEHLTEIGGNGNSNGIH